MSYFLFLDESGHDHKHAPYEVRGGVALQAECLWSFVRAMRELEQATYGDALHRYGSEIKGHKLLDRDRFRWSKQDDTLDDVARRKHAVGFLNKGIVRAPPSRIEFTAYGQASLQMARGIFELLRAHKARLFASIIPRNAIKPATFEAEEFLRKDHVFLLERFFTFLEGEQQPGILVLDETDRTEDRRFVRRLERYFTQCQTGRYRSAWIIPSPFFVSSEMTYPIQAADVCIYCINHGFRFGTMDAAVRPEIAEEFNPWIHALEWKGDGYKDGEVHHMYGITFVANPYGRGRA